MSQNKTIVPGMDFEQSGNYQQEGDLLGNLYRPTSDKEDVKEIPRTIMAGSQDEFPKEASGNQPEGVVTDPNRCLKLQDRVVVGVLFSNSRTMLGDVFPVYLGKNIIGSDKSCEICLGEESVAPFHAQLIVRKLGSPDLYEVSLNAVSEQNNVAVNSNRIFTVESIVTENDILRIGEHSDLILRLFAPETYSLQENPDFKCIGDEKKSDTVPPVPPSSPYSPSALEGNGGLYSPSPGRKNRTIIG